MLNYYMSPIQGECPVEETLKKVLLSTLKKVLLSSILVDSSPCLGLALDKETYVTKCLWLGGKS